MIFGFEEKDMICLVLILVDRFVILVMILRGEVDWLDLDVDEVSLCE